MWPPRYLDVSLCLYSWYWSSLPVNLNLYTMLPCVTRRHASERARRGSNYNTHGRQNVQPSVTLNSSRPDPPPPIVLIPRREATTCRRSPRSRDTENRTEPVIRSSMFVVIPELELSTEQADSLVSSWHTRCVISRRQHRVSRRQHSVIKQYRPRQSWSGPL